MKFINPRLLLSICFLSSVKLCALQLSFVDTLSIALLAMCPHTFS